MSDLVAAVALVQLGRARRYVDQGIANAKIYTEAVADIPWIKPQKNLPDRTNSYHIWAGVFEGDKHGISRADFAKELDNVKRADISVIREYYDC